MPSTNTFRSATVKDVSPAHNDVSFSRSPLFRCAKFVHLVSLHEAGLGLQRWSGDAVASQVQHACNAEGESGPTGGMRALACRPLPPPAAHPLAPCRHRRVLRAAAQRTLPGVRAPHLHLCGVYAGRCRRRRAAGRYRRRLRWRLGGGERRRDRLVGRVTHFWRTICGTRGARTLRRRTRRRINAKSNVAATRPRCCSPHTNPAGGTGAWRTLLPAFVVARPTDRRLVGTDLQAVPCGKGIPVRHREGAAVGPGPAAAASQAYAGELK